MYELLLQLNLTGRGTARQGEAWLGRARHGNYKIGVTILNKKFCICQIPP